jgi:co-chaperonin GroES (HSP10)
MESTTESITLTTNGIFDLGPLKMWALGDRLLIQEDEFKSGYECDGCGGKGKAQCDDCGGLGTHRRDAVTLKCSHCENGAITCSKCKGTGVWQGGIITPATAQRRPTTGVIVSTGDQCKHLKPGESVLYSNFAGYVIDLNRAGRPVTLRIIHESEVLCGMEGKLELRSFRGKSEIAEYGG